MLNENIAIPLEQAEIMPPVPHQEHITNAHAQHIEHHAVQAANAPEYGGMVVAPETASQAVASKEDKTKLMEALNPNWDINSIVNTYNSKNFNLLKSDNDKINALSGLIVYSLPTAKIAHAMDDKEAENLSPKDVEMMKSQIHLEKLLVISLLSDAVSGKTSQITEQLKKDVSEKLPSADTIKQENNELVTTPFLSKDDAMQSLINNVNKIADALQLRPQHKSFLERLF